MNLKSGLTISIYKTIFLKKSVLFQHDALIYNILQGSGGLYG